MYPLGDNGAVYDAATGAMVGRPRLAGAPGFADGMAYVPWRRRDRGVGRRDVGTRAGRRPAPARTHR